MPGKVADASVIAAFVFREPEREEAWSLIGGADIYAPTLLAYELASIARTKIVRDPSQTDFVLIGLRIGLSMGIRMRHVNQHETLQIALETRLSTYDASYLYLARTLGVQLVTFDNRLRRASQSS